MKPILISGIQPTGKLHIGNYLGALKNFVNLQNSGKYECYFFIADLHALTENPEAKDLNVSIVNLAADFLAAGLDPKKSTIFVQSQSSVLTELFWVLSALTPFGESSRMTQFKEKSITQKQNVNTGLFVYPILMAADILLYDAEFVPVGEDQLQHLELARTLARKFNKKFGKTFKEPQPILTETPRVMSLDDPMKKMSKSRPEGCLFLDDSPAEIKEKIKKAVTDSGREIKYDLKKKPAISNLLLIYSAISGIFIKEIEKKYKNKGYGEFKINLAELIIEYLAPFQRRKQFLLKSHFNRLSDVQKLKTILNIGAKKAGAVASHKIKEVKKKIGLNV